jgi:hypothetical protein
MIKGVRYLPAMPVHVAAFVRECPREQLCEALADVSRSHTDAGYADPTAGGVVSDAVNAIAQIDAPRSWPAAEKQMFERLSICRPMSQSVNNNAIRQFAVRKTNVPNRVRRSQQSNNRNRKPPMALLKTSPPALDEALVLSHQARINDFIDARVEEMKSECQGVPALVIRNILTARSNGCECRAFLQIKRQDEA